jgi:nitroreductase
MDFLELVNKRSSVRSYDSRPVERAEIDSCLEAARLAPSACNSQPWKFIIVDGPEARASLCEAMMSGIYGGMNSFIKGAPVLVVVAVDTAQWLTTVCNVVRDTKLYLIDTGIACEHFVLRAAELGIGTCWIGWFNEKAVKERLNIPRWKRVPAIISMGYPCTRSRGQGALHAEDSVRGYPCTRSRGQGALHAEDSVRGYPSSDSQSREKVRKGLSEIGGYAG